MKRYEIERAVLAARLRGPEVAIMMVLCSRINSRSGTIARQHQPSTRALARMTGYSRDTVKRHVRVLESAGWLEVTRPDPQLAAAFHLTNEYALLVPADYPQAGLIPGPGLGRHPAGAGPAIDQGLGRHSAGAGPAIDPGLGRHNGQAGPAAGHKTERQTDHRERTEIVITPDDDPQLRAALTKIAIEEIELLTGRRLQLREAWEAVRLVLTGRKVKNHEAYLRKALRAEPHRWLPAASNQPPPFSDLARLQREAIEKSDQKGSQ